MSNTPQYQTPNKNQSGKNYPGAVISGQKKGDPASKSAGSREDKQAGPDRMKNEGGNSCSSSDKKSPRS